MTEANKTSRPNSPANEPSLARNWAIPAIIALSVLFAAFYFYRTRLPATVTIAGGPKNGRYSQLARGLAEELEERLAIKVVVKETVGSLENLRLLQSREVDFALYQPETQLILEGNGADREAVVRASFVSNLYPEYLLPVSPADAPAELDAFDGPIWSCNDQLSGDYAMAKLLLRHLGINDSNVVVDSVSYVDLPKRLQQGDMNIAVACCGLQTPMLQEVLQQNTGKLVSIPAVDALAAKNTSLSSAVVPAGYFETSPPVPANDFATVTLQAQLIADGDTSVRLVEEMTRIIIDPVFQRRLSLTELFDGGIEYATQRSEFEMHAGAQHVFYPDLKPIINPDFVEGTEGLRSFVVSMLAAMWLLHRWWSRRQILSQEHRLDRYIRELLEMEKQQMNVDGEGGPDESKVLQDLLDKVTVLRQEALSEFTAHELNEDRAVDCFIEMCHALSDKISGKLTRSVLIRQRVSEPESL